MASASPSFGDVVSGMRISMPCAAASSSIATIAAVLPAIGSRRRAALVAMLTWSSWLADVGSESTECGCASALFSDASAAAVTCAIMKPELTPPSSTRNGGSPDMFESISSAMRRSDSAPTSAIASARLSAANATGSAWKLPPERISPVSANTSGLSDTALASISSTPAACRIWSRHAPITCGWQRRLYGSCTRWQSTCEARMSLCASSSR